ncbi:hypothetical protein TI05_07665 [Achromatium sp. WMS3]|nr:hypothetical protein TI05_07665 [Achromatium sp. WMS3]
MEQLAKAVLLDTTVLIDLFRGKEKAADFIEQERNTKRLLAISIVSAMELIVGCRNKIEVDKSQQLIAEFSVVQILPNISAQAYNLLVNYSKSHGLLIPDALIAATAMIYDMELATDNLRDFLILPGLHVYKPY